MSLDGRIDDVVAIGVTAGRIRRFAEAIAQGHSFGIGPGQQDQPWSVEFQRSAVTIYTKALPWKYLTRLSAGFEDCASLMVTVPGPESIAVEWLRMQQYLRSAATAIGEQTPVELDAAETVSAGDIDPVTPPVMPFHLLARELSAVGVADLRATGAAVESWAGSVDDCPLTDQEISWLRAIVEGDRVIDIAEASGYSERALYRALSDLWDRLGVENRHEALAMAVKNNWL